MKKLIKKLFAKMGLRVVSEKFLQHPHDMEKDFYKYHELIKDYTMTTTERMYAMYNSIDYLEKNHIEGAIVECGVWRGGTMMLAGYRMKDLGSQNRELYLYDTFEGMSEPTDKDVNYLEEDGEKEWSKSQKEDHNEWCYASLDEVTGNMARTGYDMNKMHFVKGKVEDTLPATLPDKIALLRLDTDWYESVHHGLVHLYPLLVENGILIIDDYGFWQGAREAVDSYFKEKNIKVLMNRVDASCRLVIKTH